MAEVKHPYDRCYLNQVVETQGRFFERLQDADEPFDTADMITAYMSGKTRAQLDAGHAYYLTLDDERSRKFSSKNPVTNRNPACLSVVSCRTGSADSMRSPNGGRRLRARNS